jgi:hypothetical protein
MQLGLTKSVIDTQVVQINKNRLRGNNITRWSSAFLLLNSFYKAYKKNIFTDENKCPVTLAEIEFYIELLLPAYRFTLGTVFIVETPYLKLRLKLSFYFWLK